MTNNDQVYEATKWTPVGTPPTEEAEYMTAWLDDDGEVTYELEFYAAPAGWSRLGHGARHATRQAWAPVPRWEP